MEQERFRSFFESEALLQDELHSWAWGVPASSTKSCRREQFWPDAEPVGSLNA